MSGFSSPDVEKSVNARDTVSRATPRQAACHELASRNASNEAAASVKARFKVKLE